MTVSMILDEKVWSCHFIHSHRNADLHFVGARISPSAGVEMQLQHASEQRVAVLSPALASAAARSSEVRF